MHWMTCTTCKAIVQMNCTGTCLGCQRGFTGTPQEDRWFNEEEESLRNKIRELEDKLDDKQ